MCEAQVVEGDRVLDAALAPEREAQRRALHADVAPAQRGQAVGAVGARVLVVADPDQGLVEQANHGREQLAAAEISRAQVALDALAQLGQRLAELQHPAEFRLVARFPVRRVVAILLAAPRVASGGLDVPGGVGTDPNFGPGRRNGERVEAPARGGIADPLAVRRVVGPSRPRAAPAYSGGYVGDIDQS